ncbi:ABC transporter permease [Lichenicoccus sp.]|uniref:ABC transporter permease n=1 Tax=Lichenicoccus sp. TaxID=2781899 RepID=UPI003D136E4D
MNATRVARRVLQTIPTLFAIVVVTFLIVRLLPGDPASAMIGDRVTDAEVARENARLGLDRPLVVQFGAYVAGLARGDLGRSTSLGVPVTQLLAARLPVTLLLTAMASLIAVAVSVPLALLAALNRGGLLDMSIRGAFQVGLSMPAFYIGILMLTWLAARLRLFPVGGYGSGAAGHVVHLLLPALSLALSLSAVLMRNLRAAICEVLDSPHVEFARLKGLEPALVLRRHVLRNALVSTVTLFGLSAGSLLGGAVVTETVFAIPGVGTLMIDSVFARDYPVIEALTLVLAALVVLTLLVTDLIQAALDPRAET